MENNPNNISETQEDSKINPVFDALDIKNHVNTLIKKDTTTSHNELLEQLLMQFEIIDFEVLVNPNIKLLKKRFFELDKILKESEGNINTDKELEKNQLEYLTISKKLSQIRLYTKHYLILSIENIIEIAKRNHWGLCKNHNFIYLYNSKFWAEVDKETFQNFLGEATEKMGVAKFNARYYQFRDQLFKQFLSIAYLPTPKQNNDKVLINLQNGTFEITPRGMVLKPFDPSNFITYQLSFEYNPEAKAPIFEAYLNKVLPDIERQKVLSEFLGYIFIKNGSNCLKEEKALILYGTGANGKSVFFEIVFALLGNENVSSYSLQSLTDTNGYYRAKLANKLANYASEINGKLETSIFKQLVSGEPVEARLPYSEPFMLTQYAKLIFNCNELPKDVEHTNAYYRRFLIINFDITIPENEQDKNLHTKIINNELSGVFNWILKGLSRLLEQKMFSTCKSADDALEKYKTESNSLKMFLVENNYISNPTDYQRIQELYSEYKNYCFEDGMHPFKKVNFSKQLIAQKIRVDREPGTGQKIAYLKKDIEQF